MGAEGCNQRVVRPRITRRSFNDALPRPGATKVTGEPKICAAFIEEFQVAELGTPFLRDPLSKQVTESTNARCIPQTIMQ